MVLDSEKQRTQLIQILEGITLQGTRKQMNESLTELNNLIGAVSSATLFAPPPPMKAENGPTPEGN